MKTIKASLLLQLLTVFLLFTFSGCYTQLALVDKENYTPIETPPPIIIYIPLPLPTPVPFFPPPAPEPLPPASPSPVVTEPSPQPANRDFGSQRSENSQTPCSDSETRTSGSKRGGR